MRCKHFRSLPKKKEEEKERIKYTAHLDGHEPCSSISLTSLKYKQRQQEKKATKIEASKFN